MEELGFERDVREYRLISKETRITKIYAMFILLSILILTISSYLIDNTKKQNATQASNYKISKSDTDSNNHKDNINYNVNNNKYTVPKKTEKAFLILNIFVIMLLVGILGAKKTIYYSSRLLKENDSLEQVLKQWKKVDIALLSISLLIPIGGFAITLAGMTFNRTTHFFIASFLLVIMLIPMGIKIRSKLRILRTYFINIL